MLWTVTNPLLATHGNIAGNYLLIIDSLDPRTISAVVHNSRCRVSHLICSLHFRCHFFHHETISESTRSSAASTPHFTSTTSGAPAKYELSTCTVGESKDRRQRKVRVVGLVAASVWTSRDDDLAASFHRRPEGVAWKEGEGAEEDQNMVRTWVEVVSSILLSEVLITKWYFKNINHYDYRL